MKKQWIVIALLCSQFTWGAEAPVLQEGQWEFTSKMVVEGMPVNMPAQTTSLCLKKEDIAKGEVPTGQPQGNQCKTLEQKLSGNTYSYKVVCTGQTQVTLTGTLQYSTNSYQGKSVVETVTQGQKMKVNSEFKARRTGACSIGK